MGLEWQDAALATAIGSKDHYIVFIIEWYPASQNANQDTNANATTNAFKKRLFELLGCKRKETLVYWVDCWQFCQFMCLKMHP